jgi:superfamily II DNA helicase RecQ
VEYRVEARESAAAAEQRVEALVRAACGAAGSRRRVVVFCRSRADCERMALRLGCHPYHRTLEQGEKEETLAAWMDGAKQVVVATTALSTGVDVAGVDLVVHLGRPYGMVDFVQEVGRGGRADGAQVQSVVVLTAHELR